MADDCSRSPSPVDRAELLHLLDSEIDYARSEATRGGWTSWALAAGGIALAAVALNEWRHGTVRIDHLRKWIVILSIPFDAFATLAWQWAQQRRSKQVVTFQFSSEWAPARFATCFWTIRSWVMVVLVLDAADAVT
jgi:hypothetical protein